MATVCGVPLAILALEEMTKSVGGRQQQRSLPWRCVPALEKYGLGGASRTQQTICARFCASAKYPCRLRDALVVYGRDNGPRSWKSHTRMVTSFHHNGEMRSVNPQ